MNNEHFNNNHLFYVDILFCIHYTHVSCTFISSLYLIQIIKSITIPLCILT